MPSRFLVPALLIAATMGLTLASSASALVPPSDGSGTVIYGTDSANTIDVRNSVANTVYAKGGNDVIRLTVYDTVYCGSGTDTVYVYSSTTSFTLYTLAIALNERNGISHSCEHFVRVG